MPYKLKENCRIANFGKSIVVLEIDKNEFNIIEPVELNELANLYEESDIESPNVLQEIMINAELLYKCNNSVQPITPFEAETFFEQRGVIRRYGNKLGMTGMILSSGIILLSLISLKLFGYRYVYWLQRRKKKAKGDTCKDLEKAYRITDHITRTFTILGGPGKCLVQSVALWHALKWFNFNPTLCIGVRTRPLLSHAWTELNDVVLNDAADLRSNLSTLWEVR